MEGYDPFVNITDDWYFCSIMNKEVRFISHILRGVTYFIVLEQKYGGQYDVPIRKNDIEQYLSKFKLIETENKKMKSKDEIEDFTEHEDFRDEEEQDTPVYIEDKKKKQLQQSPKTTIISNVPTNGVNVITVMPSLRDELFNVINLLKEGKIETSKAKEIANVSQVIINTTKLELEIIKMFPEQKKKF